FGNAAATRSFPFCYQVATAATWQWFSVTIPGDQTSGAFWLNSPNAFAALLQFTLMNGPTHAAAINQQNTWLNGKIDANPARARLHSPSFSHTLTWCGFSLLLLD